MNAKAKQLLLREADELIALGDKLIKIRQVPGEKDELTGRVSTVTAFPAFEDDYFQWDVSCDNFLRILGPIADLWKENFSSQGQNERGVRLKLATLKAIRIAIEKGLLIKAEELIRAELFDDLLEQADHLLSQNYDLAAGVIGRAVLEEHLRKWCEKESCAPTSSRPTMSDYYNALEQAAHINRLEKSHIVGMAAVGNEAAHNKPGLSRDHVERLLRDVRDFLMQHQV